MNSSEIDTFRNHLRDFSTAMLVTRARDGSDHARPMAIAKVEDDCRVWFLSGVETAKVHEIEADTRAHIVCQGGRSYLSLSGRASLVRDRTKVDELWQESYKVWFPGGKDDPNLVLLRVNPDEGEFWDNTGAKGIRYLFAAAKAYVTGTTPKVEEGIQHGRVTL